MLLWARILSVLSVALTPAPASVALTIDEPVSGFGKGAFLDGRLPPNAPHRSELFRATLAFPGIRFQNPVGLLPVPGSEHLIVWEREGRIWRFLGRKDVEDRTLMLDLSDCCQGWDDCGLLGVAFHPNYEENRHLFVWYTWVAPGTSTGGPTVRPYAFTASHNRLSRFTAGSNGVVNRESELVLIDQDTTSLWHKGGGMFFRETDGFLYLSIGDDALPPNAQRITENLFGGILRIDVDCRGGRVSHPIRRQPTKGRSANYFIPNDNPFCTIPDALEEFFCIGLRNPYRMTCDRVCDTIFIADVGGSQREEIDVIGPKEPFGCNFQWPHIEGLGGDLVQPHLGVSKSPLLDYGHGEGSAVIGGYVYRGRRFDTELGGRYIFGDNVTGAVWAIDTAQQPPSKIRLCTLPNGPGPSPGSNYVGLSSFGVDGSGELYLCQLSSEAGAIYKLERAQTVVERGMPRLLSETGAFESLRNCHAAVGLLEYDVNLPLWSDGASKRRWISLPRDSPIVYAESAEWRFPPGTVFVKNFELPINSGTDGGATLQTVETRILVIDANGGVYGASYRWRPDQSDAEIMPDGGIGEFLVLDSTGQRRKQLWPFPSSVACLQCHTTSAGLVLGVNTRQLNKSIRLRGSPEDVNQILFWSNAKMLTPRVRERSINRLPRLSPTEDQALSLQSRVRSYLDVNCGHCHRPGGIPGTWDARFVIPFAASHLFDARASVADPTAAKPLIMPGSANSSRLYMSVVTEEQAGKMPPLAHNLVDREAADLIGRWITALPPDVPIHLPWRVVSIGSGGIAGGAQNTRNGFTLSCVGTELYAQTDSCLFLYDSHPGVGGISGCVQPTDETEHGGREGFMVRAGTAADSPVGFVSASLEQGVVFEWRSRRGGKLESIKGPDIGFPAWLKIERNSSRIFAFVSSDGHQWLRVGDAEVDLPSTMMIGPAVAASAPGRLNTASFSSIHFSTSERMNSIAVGVVLAGLTYFLTTVAGLKKRKSTEASRHR